MDLDEEWVDDAHMSSELRAKVLALKTYRHRCLANATSAHAKDIAKPVIAMYLALLQNNGAFSSEDQVE